MNNTQIALITGSYSGIGVALVKQLAAKNIDLIFLNRNDAKTTAQIAELAIQFPNIQIDYEIADFGDQEAVTQAAIRIAGKHRAIHFVYLNAGWIGTQYQNSAQGHDMNFQVNVLANYVLLQLLRPSLSRGHAHIVASGSGARQMVKTKDLDLVLNKAKRAGMGAYAQSKQALVDLFIGMGAEFGAENITLNVVDLPPTKTAMAKNQAIPGIMRLFSFLFATPEKAAGKLMAAAQSRSVRSAAGKAPDEEQMQLLSEVRELTGL